jgi:hypothetical protein
MKIPNNVLTFAGKANLAPYEKFVDYYNHYLSQQKNDGSKEYQRYVTNSDGTKSEISFSEKEEKMNAALRREILRVAGINNFDEFPVETWAGNPQLTWAAFAVVSAMIDMVLPDSIIKNIGMYSEVRTIGWGDSASFDVAPRDLFVVSKGGRSKRTTELKKQYRGQQTILPELRQMTVFVSLMKVLAGKESLAELVTKMVRSFEVEMSYDVYSAFKTALDALDSTASTGLLASGWSQSEFLRLSQTVGAWNGGVRPLAIGTQVALGNILPSNANYRFELDSEYVRLGYITNFLGTDIMALPQIADWQTPFGLKLDDDRIWIISPSSDKIVKVVLEGSTFANTSDTFANANLVQTSTMWKSWGTGIITNAVAATITL